MPRLPRSAQKFLGSIIVDFSTSAQQKKMMEHIGREWLIFLTAIALGGFVMFYLTNAIVIKRLNAVINQLTKFKDGNYGARILVTGNDELSTLERSFNDMAEEISIRDRQKDDLINKITRSQMEWKTTFDCITDLISLHDKEFRIVRANKAFFEYFGLGPKDIINQYCYCLFHEACSPETTCPHRESLSKTQNATAEIVDPKTNRIFRVATFPYYSPTGELIGSVHIARDITVEREREMRLIINERLAAIGQMASGIAHDINNPLSAIAGCAESLLNRVENQKFEPELFRNYLRIIIEEISRCKRITTGILSFVRKTPAAIKNVDIHEIVSRAVEIMMHQGRLQRVEVIKKFKEGLPPVNGSEDELMQVFLAIISNALDAMEDNGTLTIETGVEDRAVIIKITDTGPGIPREYIKSIFNPFFTTKSDRGGTGLGLSIAHKIILEHHGTIDVASEEGKGAVFTITLPI